LTPEDVTQLLLGDPGTSVGLSVERQGEVQPIEFILTREEVRVKNVSFADFVNGTSIGYIKLERFGHEAHSEVVAALKSLRAESPVEGLILDLRDNPGGLLEAAVDVAGLFLPQGTEVVSTRGRLPQSQRSYRSRRVPVELETPLSVLVNRSSASASEIVAGAIQDLDRGVVVGERTFGKGLVQVVRPLPYNTSVKMTTSKYYTPSGRSIQSVNYTHRAEDGYAVVIADSLQEIFTTEAGREVRGGGGIAPDVEVAFAKPSGLEEALIRKSAFFRFANRFASENPDIPQDFVPTAETIEAFREWLEKDGFSYVDRTEWLLDEIQNRAAEVDYSVGGEVEALRSSIEREKAGDFERYNDELREHLRREILARYHGESALIRASLTHDRQLETSIDILSDRKKLDDILGSKR
jgi:carboxyl-terminal processing protease